MWVENGNAAVKQVQSSGLSSSGEGHASMRRCATRILALACMVSLPLAGQTHHARHKKPVAPAPVETAPPAPVAPPNPLEQPAVRATVTENNQALSVKADNSSLSDILHQVASATGMKLEGLSSDERVFGSFGPGAPREVLSALLNGTPYNVMMVGDLPSGAPRQLVLSRKGSGAAPPAASTPAQPPPQQQPTDEPDEETGAESYPEPGVMPSIAPATNLPPGQQVPGIPQQPGQPQPGQPQQGEPQVRTPQQLLQQLQEQQQQQQRNQQSAPPQ